MIYFYGSPRSSTSYVTNDTIQSGAAVTVFVDCDGLIDLAFVLHSAGTVHPERWHHITQFVIDIVERLDVGLNRTRVAVVTWSDTAHVAFTLDQFTARQDVFQVLLQVTVDRRTDHIESN